MSHNTWIHKLSRAVIVRPMIAIGATPNQVTTARLAAGLGAAACVAAGVTPWLEIGAGVFVLSMLLDRADGDLARATGQISQTGHRFDLIADTLCNAAIFVGLGWGVQASGGGPWAAGLGLVAGLAVAAVLALVVRIEEQAGARAAELGGAAGFDPDDAMLVVPLAIWFGWADTVLMAAAVGAPAFVLFFLVRFRGALFGDQTQITRRARHHMPSVHKQ